VLLIRASQIRPRTSRRQSENVGSSLADQAAAFDRRGERGLVELLAARAPARRAAMRLDRQRHGAEVDLLDHPRCEGGGGPQVVPAGRAGVEAMIEGPGVEGLRQERDAFVLGMSGLPADSVLILALRRWRLGRLDDVGRGGIGGGRGIFPRGSELRLQARDSGVEPLDLRLQGVELRLLGVESRLQSSAIRATGCELGSHGGGFYILNLRETTPVNGHRRRGRPADPADPADPKVACAGESFKPMFSKCTGVEGRLADPADPKFYP
jgi:hypothetical protein